MDKDITLTQSQSRALKAMTDFVSSDDRVFILKGYAGTGKTTLMRFLIEHLEKEHILYRLLSTTGRAAKILSNYTKHSASTIHSMIYSYKDFNQDMSEVEEKKLNVDETGQLYLVFEPSVLDTKSQDETIYIIDESSMISDTKTTNIVQAQFGSGRLLKELLDYDKRPKSKFIFVGDPCQLPPVNDVLSPALDASYIKDTFDLGVAEATLTQIMRQSDGNTIVAASNSVRSDWSNAPESAEIYGKSKVWARLKLKNYPDIHLANDLVQMQEEYIRDIQQNGYNKAVFICRSNADCYKMSSYFRSKLGFTGGVAKGDLLMVIQNQLTTGLMNGDMVVVEKVNPRLEHIINSVDNRGYRTTLAFREVEVRELFSDKTYNTLIIENTLNMQQNNLDSRTQTGLFLDFIIRMRQMNVRQKSHAFKSAMMEDPYLNALRCSYGYAVTCHKAQGGEWDNVYIHIGARNITLNPTKATYQWIYTAITRGKKAVHLVNDFYIQ